MATVNPPADQTLPTLAGRNVLLRPPQPADKAERQRHGRNGEYVRMVGGDEQQDGPMSDESAQRWYEDRCNQPYTWMIEWQGRAIGHTRLHQLDLDNLRARFAIGIFNPACWSKGLGAEAALLTLGYAFDILHLHRVDLRVLAYNQRALRAYSKVGFVQEGIEREGAWIAGRWESDICMSILEQEFRAITKTGDK